MKYASELHEKLSRLQWLMHRYYLTSREANGPFSDVTRGQGKVLSILKMKPAMSTKELSYLLGIRTQSLNELLGKLEKAGYITREPLKRDRRATEVKLTEDGRAVEQGGNDLSDVLNCLSAEEQQLAASYLSRIIGALEDRMGIGADEDMMDWMAQLRARMGGQMMERMKAHRGGARRPCPPDEV